jgi:hypothetical protein
MGEYYPDELEAEKRFGKNWKKSHQKILQALNYGSYYLKLLPEELRCKKEYLLLSIEDCPEVIKYATDFGCF